VEEKPAFDLKLFDLILKQQAAAALQLSFRLSADAEEQHNPGHRLLFDT
jgi:hypothetical protein